MSPCADTVDVPEDPEPVEIPEPIPDADEPVRRGRWLGGEKDE